MNKFLCCLFLVILSSACQNRYNFHRIEQFNISENGLQNNEKVKVIYYTGGYYDEYADNGFYRHAIVISSITNDTVNVLTFPESDLEYLDASNNIFTFNNKPDIMKSIENFDSLPDEMKKTIEKIDPAIASWPKYAFVIRDPKFDRITINNLTTVIGSLTK